MKILLLRTHEDEAFLPNFQRLKSLQNVRLVQTVTPHVNTATVAHLCDKHGIDAIVCTQQKFLEAALVASPDYTPPPNRKQITLDDFAGSLLEIKGQKRSYECVILNPLPRLFSVPHEKFVVDRYVSKLTKPSDWWPQTKFQWKEVEEHQVSEVCARLEQARLIGIDIETADAIREKGTEEVLADPVITCVSYTGYFPDTNTTETYVIGMNQMWQVYAMRRFNATKPAKVFQNGSYDNTWMLRYAAPVRNWLHDTQHLFHSWLSELPKRLDFVTLFALRAVRFWKDDGKTGRLTDLYRYCGLDSWATVNSYLALLQIAPKWAITNYLQEFPLVFPGINAALEGICVDKELFEENKAETLKNIYSYRTRINGILGIKYIPGTKPGKPGAGFNPSSSDQMLNLFGILGCRYLGSTDKAAMLKAKAAHPLNDLILTICTDYREGVKLYGTYFKDSVVWYGRIFYSFNPAATDSGRLASYASVFYCGHQIQNVPRGFAIKQHCIADPGWYFAEADKAQSEARCVGYLSGEEKLINLVESEHDYHAWNASAFFGIPYESIYDERTRKTLDVPIRDLSKRTNHGANYNMGGQVMLDTMGPKKVAEAKRVLKLPYSWGLVRVCDYLLDRYADTYPGVKTTWYQQIISTIEITKKLISPFGWVRLFFIEPKKSKPALNSAVAHGPQNLSVTIINREWYAIWRETVYGELRGHIRIKAQIHDSLLFIYKQLEWAKKVHAMMNTKVQVTGADGKTRTMLIPTDLSTGKSGPVRRWSELK